ncbi:MAG: hypothetical protein HZB67_03645 [Candidatus Aenigmarchaeota archaeon]|nr:hypothetical protein [Candidatus Aenigmarchaeota archaeon]
MNLSKQVQRYQRKNIIKAANFRRVKIPKVLDKDLAYFVGILRDGVLTCREGSKGDYEVEIYQKNAEWLEKVVKPLVRKLFGVEVKVTYQHKKTGTVGRIRIYSKIVYLFLKEVFEHPDTNKQKTCWKTPSLILKATSKIKQSYAQGFFDAEGYIAKDLRTIIIGQAWDKEGPSPLSDIKYILEEIGITCYLTRVIDKRGGRKPLEILRIHRKDSIHKFIRKIGSRHPNKLDRFKKFDDLFAPDLVA